MYKKRTIEKVIKNVGSTFPIILLNGSRQVGKTTVLKYCMDNSMSYVTLDDLSNRELAKKDPKLFLERNKFPLLIDEIQYAPELFPYIKIIVDNENKNNLYWFTGSQQFSLMKNVLESLAGRIGILNLQGLSQSEKLDTIDVGKFLPTNEYIEKKRSLSKRIDLHELYELIWRGSFPRISLNKDVDWNIFYSSYLQTYIERDVRQISNISNELTFMNFIRYTAARTGQELNYFDISDNIGVSQTIVKSWISILKTSGLIYLLEPYYTNISNRIIKRPKLYFLDTGLVCYLTKYQNSELLESGAMNGSLLETYVISEILKTYWYNGLEPNLSYYRDKEKKEIDLIIEENNTLYPIEIKRKSEPKKDDIKNFNILNKYNKTIGKGAVICLADTDIPITREVNSVPVFYL